MTNLESGQRTSPFLSYCWDDLDMAYMLEALLAAKGVELIWDKRCLKLDDSISQFMSLGLLGGHSSGQQLLFEVPKLHERGARGAERLRAPAAHQAFDSSLCTDLFP